jgi:hypothetical protein
VDFGVFLDVLLVVGVFEEFLEDLLFDTEVKIGDDESGYEELDFDEIEEVGKPEAEHLSRPECKQPLGSRRPRRMLQKVEHKNNRANNTKQEHKRVKGNTSNSEADKGSQVVDKIGGKISHIYV